MIRTACPLVFACALAAALPAAAQEPSVAAPQPVIASPSESVLSRATDSAVVPSSFKAHRPDALVPLYVSFSALQGLDYASTTRALESGAGREANPVMRGIVGNRAAFIAVKAAATTGVILAGEKMWKKNRVAAVIFVAAANVAMGAVVARNYSIH